jgi:hypothetical protein
VKVFLSWSGDRSKGVALALSGWIPRVLHKVQPFMSEEHIAKGLDRLKLCFASSETQSLGSIALLLRI